MKTFLDILELIEHRTGLTARSLGGSDVLQRTVNGEMQAAGIRSAAEFYTHVLGDDRAWNRLIDRIVVPETFFLRHPESFLFLTNWAKAHLEKADRLRILSLPCSTGEEAYSIAAHFSDAGIPWARTEILGVDLSPAAVKAARTAEYSSNAFRGVENEFLGRHFQPHGDRLRLNESLRSRVHFETGNLLNLAYVPGEWDVILCRNLLIYFAAETQERSLSRLRAMLSPNGLLMLGPAEAPLASSLGWESVRSPMTFCFRKMPAASCQAAASPPRPLLAKPIQSPVPSARRSAPRLQEHRPDPTPSLVEVRKLANAGQLAAATKILDQYNAANSPCSESKFLQGLLAEAANQLEDAEHAYRRAIYLSPRDPEILSHLALLLESLNRHDAARQFRRRARSTQTLP